jgi:hypothetical protein
MIKMNKYVSVGMLFLLSASTAQAANVELDGSDNVIRVTNLELNFDNDALDGFYNVEFITGTGSFIFGTEPANFPFPLAEDMLAATIQLNDALSGAPVVPTGAGTVGAERYLVPAIEYDFPFPPDFPTVWAAATGQYFDIAGGTWEQCQGDDCLAGITVLPPDGVATFATFSAVPVPAAVWLFGSGLLGLIGIARRKKA